MYITVVQHASPAIHNKDNTHIFQKDMKMNAEKLYRYTAISKKVAPVIRDA